MGFLPDNDKNRDVNNSMIKRIADVYQNGELIITDRSGHKSKNEPFDQKRPTT